MLDRVFMEQLTHILVVGAAFLSVINTIVLIYNYYKTEALERKVEQVKSATCKVINSLWPTRAEKREAGVECDNLDDDC